MMKYEEPNMNIILLQMAGDVITLSWTETGGGSDDGDDFGNWK